MTAWLCLPSRSKCRCQTHPIPTHRLDKEASLSPSPVRILKAVDRLQPTNLSAGRQVGSHLRGDRSSWVNSRIRSARRSDPTKARREQRSQAESVFGGTPSPGVKEQVPQQPSLLLRSNCFQSNLVQMGRNICHKIAVKDLRAWVLCIKPFRGPLSDRAACGLSRAALRVSDLCDLREWLELSLRSTPSTSYSRITTRRS